MSEGSDHFKKPCSLIMDGNIKESWRKFKNMWDIYTVASKTIKESEDIQVARFLSCAGDQAIEVFNTLPLNEEQKKKINDVIKAFHTYCVPRSNVVYERYLFFSRYQREGEPMEQFFSDITKLAESCEFETQKESMIRDRIVIGITDHTVRLQLLKIDDLTLPKAKEICRVAEEAERQAKRMENERGPVVAAITGGYRDNTNFNKTESIKFHSRFVKKDGDQQRSMVSQKSFEQNIRQCNRCNRKHVQGRCPADGKRCLACGNFNHFASVCRKNRNVGHNAKKVNEVNYDYDSSESNESVVYVSVLHFGPYSRNSWHETLKIDKLCIDFKLDSGAEVNIITYDIVKRLTKLQDIKSSTAKLEAYGGFQIQTVGSIVLLTEYKDKS